MATTAFPLKSQYGGASQGFDDTVWDEWSPFTYPFNLTGQPAATVPCGFTSNGLPVGLQIVGRPFDDVGVLRAARAFESAKPEHWRRPPDQNIPGT
jgi:aspartyl-tRNA(Asn)/glutamyl-tRNA(Gln) amidotransferase subunit A